MGLGRVNILGLSSNVTATVLWFSYGCSLVVGNYNYMPTKDSRELRSDY